MGEQLGTKLVGTTTYKQLFKSSLGPDDVVACVIVGNAAATYLMGDAIRNSATSGLKKKYTNAAAVNDEAVGTGNGSTTTFDLAHSNVIAESLKGYSAGNQKNVSLSVGTGTDGKDQIVFAVAPANAEAIKADYDYHADSIGTTGACILMEDVTTTVGGGNVTADACRDGSVDSSKVLDSAGAAVDKYFKAALPKAMFD